MNIQAYKEKYPKLFGSDETRTSFTVFGFECSDGWSTIIDNVFRLLYARYNSCKSSLDFWQQQLDKLQSENTESTEDVAKARSFVEQYSSELTQQEEKIPVIHQVKEKFGTLRIYTSHADDYIRGVIDMAELLSASTCECCGSAGKLYRQGWHKTLCVQHAIEKKKINIADS